MDELVIMVIKGVVVDYLVRSNPKKYKPFVHIGADGKKRIYLKLLKALYGCIKSALLWYNLFTSVLKGWGFELNPYDMCVANKTIKGK